MLIQEQFTNCPKISKTTNSYFDSLKKGYKKENTFDDNLNFLDQVQNLIVNYAKQHNSSEYTKEFLFKNLNSEFAAEIARLESNCQKNLLKLFSLRLLA